MFKIICVTNRKLCTDFQTRLKHLCQNDVPVILREKDLTETEYEMLAKNAKTVCPNIICHSYAKAALNVGINQIHVPLALMNKEIRRNFKNVGVSVHSASEAVQAQALGADYIVAGHVFQTECKKNVPPRGLDFLCTVKNSVNIPVYAIGGITPRNILQVKQNGIDGCCIMSGFMTCNNVSEFLSELKKY